MVRRRFILMPLLSALAWLACVGEDPAPSGGPRDGTRLGACFENRTCNDGLECRLPEGICLVAGEPTPAGFDGGGGGDGGSELDGRMTSDDDASAGPTCPSAPASPGQTQCDGKTCAVNGKEACCVGPDASTCTTGGCAGVNRELDCDNGGCPTGQVCCLVQPQGYRAIGVCRAAMRAFGSACREACPVELYPFCINGTCPADFSCRQVEVNLDAGPSRVFDICIPGDPT